MQKIYYFICYQFDRSLIKLSKLNILSLIFFFYIVFHF